MKRFRGPLLAGITVLLGALSCGSDDASSDPGDPGDGSAALPACSWDTGSLGECNAARVLLECRGPNDVRQTCLSNDPAGCPAPSPSHPDAVCTNQCEPGEHAVWCGGIGSAAPVPAGCRPLTDLPSGSTLGCCPCEP